ncbi:MAG: gliding motility-associated C-terminal domain-containing protein [Saprospiraceae bacterium]
MNSLTRLYVLAFVLLCSAPLFAQVQTFQRIIGQTTNFQTFDGKQTPDGGFAAAGIFTDNGTQRLAVVKYDCEGTQEWLKTFGTSSTVQNVSPSICIGEDGTLAFVGNPGVFMAYDMMVVRLALDGSVIWQRIVNQGQGNDGGHAIQPTADNGFVVTGYTNTYGQETPGSSYRDIYLVKFDSDGNVEWSKTYGTNETYDEGSVVIQTNDGGYALGGRMIDRGAFHAFLLKTDPSGTPEFLRTYGDTLHANWSFGLAQLPDDGYVLVGSTTLLKNNFQDWADNYVLRTDSQGDTLWTRAFYGNPDRFENARSVEIGSDGNIYVGVATAGYPSTGFVPNKHMAVAYTPDGELLSALLFNPGGSHYPFLTKTGNEGFLLTGFSNFYTPDFTAFLSKTNDQLNPGCNISDVTGLTVSAPAPFIVRSPDFQVSSGINDNNYSIIFDAATPDTTLCQMASPGPTAQGMATDACVNADAQFTSTSMGGVVATYWLFPDTTLEGESVLYAFDAPGMYFVGLRVSDGCKEDSTELVVNILGLPEIDLGMDTTLCTGDSLLLDAGTDLIGYSWSDGSTEQTLLVLQAGTYAVTVDDGNCTNSDSIQVDFQDPPVVSLGPDSTFCMGDTLLLDAGVDFASYLWSDGSTSQFINAISEGLYAVTVSDGLCENSATVQLSTIDCDTMNSDFILPNAFTPDGDGVNDVWRPTVGSDYTLINLDIYNRWGERMYTTEETAGFEWDGKFNGLIQTSDIYIYVLRYTYLGEEQVKKGDITLLR